MTRIRRQELAGGSGLYRLAEPEAGATFPTPDGGQVCVNRAGTRTAYFWGDSDKDLPLYANMNGKGTTPVGSFEPNPWVLFDITGNVWSLTQDRWHKNYTVAPTDGSAWEAGCDSRLASR
jgi:hypothetical protein